MYETPQHNNRFIYIYNELLVCNIAITLYDHQSFKGLKIFPSILNKDSIGDTVSQSLLMDDMSDNFFLQKKVGQHFKGFIKLESIFKIPEIMV